MYGWKPRMKPRGLDPGERPVKLMITPKGIVTRSVSAADNSEEACIECAAAGVDLTVLDRFGARVVHTHRRINVVVVEVSAARAKDLERELRDLGMSVERSKPVIPMLNESIPQMGVDSVWRLDFSGRGIRVGVADTGIDQSHPDFKGRIGSYLDFTGTDLSDPVGHGTHVCGIIAGGGKTFRGVAPAATLVVAKVLTEEGGESADVLAGLSWLSKQEVAVINVSLGGSGNPGDALSRECDAIVRDGIVVCVAAGNEGPDAATIGSPACAASVIAVGAVDKDDHLAAYSSRGPVRWRRKTWHKPDVLAVGGGVGEDGDACYYPRGIASAKSRKMGKNPCDVQPAGSVKKYVRMSGTSMATPHVTGVVALLIESFRTSQRTGAPDQIREVFERTCRKLKYKVDEQGVGRVDALAAIRAAQAQNARPRSRKVQA